MHMPNLGVDQANGLRNRDTNDPVRVIAVTGGKGGVGKTTVSVNLAMALARGGRRVMLLDADLGLANVDVLLGLKSEKNLSHVINGQCSLDDIVLDGPCGIKVLPASSGVKSLAEITTAQSSGLIWAFGQLQTPIDDLVIDTAAGIADNVIRFSAAAQDVVVVVCDEPASITDAYALIKILSRDHRVSRFQVLANKTASVAEARGLYEKLSKVTQRFLDVHLSFMGHIPRDSNVRKAIQRQCGVVEHYPNSRAARAFEDAARATTRWPRADGSRGCIEFFAERLVQGTAA
ncbi:MAG: MinD/ParA family protein [Gammaproteobacteria bacterium]